MLCNPLAGSSSPVWGVARCLQIRASQPRRSGHVFDEIDVHLIDLFIHLVLVHMNQSKTHRKALLLEPDGLVAERARQMLSGEAFLTCWVADSGLTRIVLKN